MADEEVLLENSPLQEYLDEIGFTDFERAQICVPQDTHAESRISSLLAWIRMFFPQGSLPWKSWFQLTCMSTWFFSFLFLPGERDLDEFREEYIVAVIESKMLSDEDSRFLSHFDPRLFKRIEEISQPYDSHKVKYFYSGRPVFVISAIVVIASVFLAAVTDFGFTPLALLMLCVGILPVRQYYFRILHQGNLNMLTSFTVQMKQLDLFLRKSVKLIQEMEHLIKGYTMVSSIIPVFAEDDNTRLVFPELRKAVLKNVDIVISCLQKTTRELAISFPLSLELSGVFTYLSKQTEEVRPRYSNDGLSLQHLKTATIMVYALQSELLSRFLLSLSLEANDGNLSQLYLKLLTKVNKIFGISFRDIETSAKSISLSYQIHKSYCFENEELVNNSKGPSIQLTPPPVDAAIHSLKLHLQVGILRVQSLQQIMSEVSKAGKGKDLVTEESCLNNKMKTTFQWLKIDLESAIRCWQESEKGFNKIFGNESIEEPSKKVSLAIDFFNLENSIENFIVNSKQEEPEDDRVYEDFSDPLNDDRSIQSVSVREIGKEENTLKENTRLLQELKAVLFTKTKDPLISSAGYVKPISALGYTQKNTLQIDKHIVKESSKPEIYEVFAAKNTEKDNIKRRKLFSESFDDEEEEEEERQPTKLTNLHSSVASSAATAAIMRSKAFGLTEEKFIGDSDS